MVMQSQRPSMATMSLIPAHRFAVKDACMLYSSLWLTRDRAHVVACSSPSLISSAAIVQGSPSISHLLACKQAGKRAFQGEGFFGQKVAPPLMDCQGRMQSHALRLKTENIFDACDTHWTRSGQKQFHPRYSARLACH